MPNKSKRTGLSDPATNYTIGGSKKSKKPIVNGNTTNIVSKSVVPTVSIEPPRVPALHHPVPFPDTNTVKAAVGIKTSANRNGKLAVSSISTTEPLSTATSIQKPVTDASSQQPYPLSVDALLSNSVDYRDINELISYIEGNKTEDKDAIANKKAVKKARQRLKKAQEREEKLFIELEKQKLKEEAIRKEAKLKEKVLKGKAAVQQKVCIKEDIKKNGKRKGSKQENNDSTIVEENIPAIVTIKRVAESNNAPASVTITLKGTTPDADKLLLTLVNGIDNGVKEDTPMQNKTKVKSNNSNKPTQPVSTQNEKPSKKKKEKTITVTKSMKGNVTTNDPMRSSHVQQNEVTNTNYKQENDSKDEISLHMLNLPPGITITKINKNPNSATCKNLNENNSHENKTRNSNPPANKCGVTVVDTEKLIQQFIAVSINKEDKKIGKKKRHQKVLPCKTSQFEKSHAATKMVTLKNPLFKAQQNKLTDKSSPDVPTDHQAVIFEGKDGMVTIRSPWIQNRFKAATPHSSYFSDTEPPCTSEVVSSFGSVQQPKLSETIKSPQFSRYTSPDRVREFLAGLPGIEITQINKPTADSKYENKQVTKQPEESTVCMDDVVNGIDTLHFDAENWYYENVFKPKEEYEEDAVDDEKLELEEFKQFCNQRFSKANSNATTNLTTKRQSFNTKDVIYA